MKRHQRMGGEAERAKQAIRESGRDKDMERFRDREALR